MLVCEGCPGGPQFEMYVRKGNREIKLKLPPCFIGLTMFMFVFFAYV